MRSLNDLDQLIAAVGLEDEDDNSTREDSDEELEEKRKKKKRGNSFNGGASSSSSTITGSSSSLEGKKKRKTAHGLCFKYLANECTFEDCLFRHERLERLDEKDLAQLMQDLRKRPYDEALAKRIRDLNIPKCKDFARGFCKHELKCRFWHLDNAHISRWAGFSFYCDACWKPLTSIDQKEEHDNSMKHLNNMRTCGGNENGSGIWGKKSAGHNR